MTTVSFEALVMSVVQWNLMTSSRLPNGSQLVAVEIPREDTVPVMGLTVLSPSCPYSKSVAVIVTPTRPGSTTSTPLGTYRPGA